MKTNIQVIAKNNIGIYDELAKHFGLTYNAIYKVINLNNTTTRKQKRKYLEALIELEYIKEWDFTFLTLFDKA